MYAFSLYNESETFNSFLHYRQTCYQTNSTYTWNYGKKQHRIIAHLKIIDNQGNINLFIIFLFVLKRISWESNQTDTKKLKLKVIHKFTIKNTKIKKLILVLSKANALLISSQETQRSHLIGVRKNWSESPQTLASELRIHCLIANCEQLQFGQFANNARDFPRS